MEIALITILLAATLVLLMTEMIAVDLTGLVIMTVLMTFGILPPAEAVAGLASPAVVTVGAMFVISRAMMRTGAVGYIGQKVIEASGGRSRRAFGLVMIIVALASAFINNTPVVVLFIPVVLSLTCQFELSPSKFLIPMSYASILAGTCTLIGTSTNIIVSDLSAARGYGALGMFELSRLGVPIAAIGLIVLYFIGPRLMPAMTSPVCEIGDGEHRRYLAELAVPKGSPLIGKTPVDAFARDYPGLEIFEVIRYSHILYPGREPVILAPDDLLLVKGSASDLVAMLETKGVTLPRSEEGLRFGRGERDILVVELIVPPQSDLIGEKIVDTTIRRDPEIRMVAIKRSGLHYTEKQIDDVRLKIGDILLVACPLEKIEALRRQTDTIVVEDVHHEIVLRRKAGRAVAIFAAMVGAATFGLADIMVCALTGAVLMILSGCLQLRDAYRAMQPKVLILIAGTIALGTAMEKTGTSRLYAEAFLSAFTGASPQWILGGILLLTSLSTQILSNNATAVLLLPIAVSAALELGLDPKPFIVAVCFGASACFATPIGYQTNLLVYGPGGYRFSDYLKIGIPLNLLVLGMGTAFIPVLWPF
jgi:di/tricarboxylate transporter